MAALPEGVADAIMVSLFCTLQSYTFHQASLKPLSVYTSCTIFRIFHSPGLKKDALRGQNPALYISLFAQLCNQKIQR